MVCFCDVVVWVCAGVVVVFGPCGAGVVAAVGVADGGVGVLGVVVFVVGVVVEGLVGVVVVCGECECGFECCECVGEVLDCADVFVEGGL